MAVGVKIDADYGLKDSGALCWSMFLEGVRHHTFNLALEQLGIEATPAYILSLVRLYREHWPIIALMSDAKVALNALSTHFRLAALTDGPLASQSAKVRALQLSQWMEHIIFTSAIEAPKPDTKGFSRIQSVLGCEGAQCLYIADNPHKDFLGPKELGWHTLRIIRDGGLHADAPSGDDVDRCCNDLSWIAESLL